MEGTNTELTPSFTTISMNQVVRSAHVNKCNHLDGGQLLKWVDICACLSAERLAAYPCVTVSVDDLYFEQEIKLGDVLSLKAKVNRVFNTSMEVGVKAFCESLRNNTRVLVCKAYITFVALDKQAKKVKLPCMECTSDSQQARFALASERRRVRISHSTTVQKLLDDYEPTPINMKAYDRVTDDVFKSNRYVKGADTSVESVELVLPPHANHHGNTFGGQIMAWMENNASISAGRYFGSEATLKSVDMVHFKGPSTVGDRVVIHSTVNNAFKNSLEVGVRVEAYRYEDGRTGPTRHINSAFFTYDATEDHREFPTFIPINEEGERRMKEACARRKLRFDRRYSLSQETSSTSSISSCGDLPRRSSIMINSSNSTMLCCSNIITFSQLASLRDWKVISSTGETELATREKDGVLSFRVTLNFNKHKYDAGKVFKVLRNPTLRPLWDSMMQSCDEVSCVSRDDSVYHLIVRSPDVEKSNDFVLLVSSRVPETESGSYKVAMRSVELSSFPETEEYQRMNNTCSGFLISSKKNICTKIVYYNNASAQIASYITRDMAGLSKKYHTTFTSLHKYLNEHIGNNSNL